LKNDESHEPVSVRKRSGWCFFTYPIASWPSILGKTAGRSFNK